MDKYTFGKNLYELRNKKGLTQKELGKLLGVSDKAVSKWETGEAMPRTAKLVLITDLFGVTMEQLSSEDFDCNAEDFRQNETPEQKESRYKKYFDKAMKQYCRGIKISITSAKIAIAVSIIALVVSIVTAGIAGVAVSLWETALFSLLPIFILIYGLELLKNLYKNREHLNVSDFMPVLVVLIIFSVVFCAIGLINDVSKESVSVVGGCLITVISFIWQIKLIRSKDKSELTENKSVIIMVLACTGVVVSAITYISNITALFILFTQMALTFCAADLLSVAIITSALENDVDENKSKDKHKFLKRTLTVTSTSFLIASIVLIMFPGLILKVGCQIIQKNTDVNAQWETEGISFEKGESKTIEMDWISLDIPKDLKKKDSETYDDTTSKGYEKEGVVNVSIRKMTDGAFADFDLFEPKDDTEEEKLVNELYLMNFQKYFGFIPSNMYEYLRLAGSLDADDMKFYDYIQCVLYAQLIMTNQMQSFAGANDIYYLDTDETYGELTIIDSSEIVESSQQVSASYVIVDKNNVNVEYQIVVVVHNGDKDLLHKVINSVEIDL